jgi:hypothetical protein
MKGSNIYPYGTPIPDDETIIVERVLYQVIIDFCLSPPKTGCGVTAESKRFARHLKRLSLSNPWATVTTWEKPDGKPPTEPESSHAIRFSRHRANGNGGRMIDGDLRPDELPLAAHARA